MGPIKISDPPKFKTGQLPKVVDRKIVKRADGTPETYPLEWYELYYDNQSKRSTLRFTFEIFGKQPADGYALYIGLHGGGDTFKEDNDWLWYNMAWYYRGSVEKLGKNPPPSKPGTIYITLRSDSNTYDTHFRPESYILLEQLIIRLLAPTLQNYEWIKQNPAFTATSTADKYMLDTSSQHLVNSNLVYLLGFSAGGDGVYQLATRLPDLFAAVNMSAGHHNWIRFDNLANVPFCLQVGDSDREYDRNLVTVDNAFALEALARNLPKYYTHSCFVHSELGTHNDWSEAEYGDAKLNIVTDGHAWRDQWRRSGSLVTNPTAARAEWKEKKQNTNAARWVSAFVRQPLPDTVVWDLPSNPPLPDGEPARVTKKFCYWLYLRDSADAQGSNRTIRASFERASSSAAFNSIAFDREPPEYVGVLLNEAMVDFAKPVRVQFRVADPDNFRADVRVVPKQAIRDETRAARGDERLIFGAALWFRKRERTEGETVLSVKEGMLWTVTQADSVWT